MKPLSIIYWTKVILGVVVGLLSGLLSAAAGNLSIGFNLFNGISIALLIYIIAYYVYKRLFLAQVGKTTKLLTAGIGGYFLTWIVIFGLVFTLLSPILTITSPSPDERFKAGDSMTIAAYIAAPFGGPTVSDANVNATISLMNGTTLTTLRLNSSQTSPGHYVTNYPINSTDQVDWRVTVTALIDNRYLEFAGVTVKINPTA